MSDGLEAARGRNGGRRAKLTPAQIEQAQRLYDEGRHTAQQIADILGVKRGTAPARVVRVGRGGRVVDETVRCSPVRYRRV